MTFKQLVLVFVVATLSLCGRVSAQNDAYPTDTVYHSEFGCDSFLLTSNNTVYYHDTTVEIPHRIAVDGLIVTDVLNIYNISVGQSYDVKDTVEARVCRNNLPYAFRQNFYTATGDYWISSPTVSGCDSAQTLLSLRVLEGQKDTARLTLCFNQASVWCDGIEFTTSGTFDFVQGADSDGCPIVKTYVVTQYPLESDTVYDEVCYNELPYFFMGNSYASSGSFPVIHTSATGCSAVTTLVLTVRPASNLSDTINAAICQTDLPYVYDGRSYTSSGTYHIYKYNIYGCDSLHVVLNLSVSEPRIDTVSVTLCPESFPYSLDSLHTFDKPGTYFINNNPDTACSNYTMLVLNAYPVVRDTVNICTSDSSYTFGDTTFTVSTVYTYTQLNADSCLDYHTLRVMLNTVPTVETKDVTICESQRPYDFTAPPTMHPARTIRR